MAQNDENSGRKRAPFWSTSFPAHANLRSPRRMDRFVIRPFYPAHKRVDARPMANIVAAMSASQKQFASGAAVAAPNRGGNKARGPIWIGNDHGGYELKLKLLEQLRGLDIEYHDAGSHSSEIVRYPNLAAEVAGAVSSGVAARGILICSTGIGMSIIANKYRGVRAALCTSSYMGKMTRAHNDSNILCLGGKITGELEAIDILKTWLHTDYMGGRHCISLGLIAEAEAVLCTNELWQPVGAMKLESSP